MTISGKSTLFICNLDIEEGRAGTAAPYDAAPRCSARFDAASALRTWPASVGQRGLRSQNTSPASRGPMMPPRRHHACRLSYINSCISNTWGTSFAAHGPPSGETNAPIGHSKVSLRRARDALGYTNQRVLDPSGVSKTLICSQAHSPHQLPTICYTAGRELAVRVLRARPPGSFRGLPPTPGTLLQRVKRTRSSLRRH